MGQEFFSCGAINPNIPSKNFIMEQKQVLVGGRDCYTSIKNLS